jgi:hypothetical protein
MRKFLFNAFAISMALTTSLLTSCSNDDDPNGGDAAGTKNVALRIDLPTVGATRTVGAQIANGTTLTLSNGSVVFYANDGRITKKLSIVTSLPSPVPADTYSFDQMKQGVTISGLDNATASVAVVGNTDISSATGGENWEDWIKTDSIQAGSQTAEGTVNLYGASALKTPQTTGDPYQATISLQPTVARFEVASVKPGTDLSSFTVEGVYLENFYKEGAVDGGLQAIHVKGLTKTDAAMTDYSVTGAGLSPTWTGSIYDAGSWAINTTDNVPAANKVWGYYAFAHQRGSYTLAQADSVFQTDPNYQSANGGTVVPRIIIKLTHVALATGRTGNETNYDYYYGVTDASAGTTAGDKVWYATIKGFKFTPSGGTTPVEMKSILAGYVYATDPQFSISSSDLHPDPNTGTITADLQVVPITWRGTTLTPIL